MDMDLSQDASQQQQMKVSPRLVAASYILELSSLELQQAVQQELSENPAMEMVEASRCPVCGGNMEGNVCPHCLAERKATDESRNEQSEVPEDYVPTHGLSASGDDDFDPLTQVAAQMTLPERLLTELQSLLPGEDMPIAEFLVGNLDENGYLRASVQEAAELFDTDKSRVELVLRHLQSLDPIGIGARDLRECLLIQLDYLEEQGITHANAREVIKKHLTQLGEHKFGRIASEMGISSDEVADVWDFIKHHLNPYPAQGDSVPEPGRNEPISTYVMPDVIIKKGEDGYEVDVVESKRFVLRLSPIYNQLSAELEHGNERFSEEERRHIQQYVSRAKLFIANINQRRQTIQRITTTIVDEQREFLDLGIRHLRPLTRAQVAQHLGMHESTVSRATASKYVMLPDGRVIPFSDFFTASLSVKDVIKELIVSEKTPLTDQEIAAKLDNVGIHVARRTVAKYREQLNILPSSLR
ncbi:MAG: RNA polymerase factor sigma-54 [Chloroflexi bacterium]|nr:RNA polymerase factor sigma-54 [Chloroflexota bacterium]MCL5110955.1 RNA polymerase factor sigma-54 [Chloroflexota bacterium]